MLWVYPYAVNVLEIITCNCNKHSSIKMEYLFPCQRVTVSLLVTPLLFSEHTWLLIMSVTNITEEQIINWKPNDLWNVIWDIIQMSICSSTCYYVILIMIQRALLFDCDICIMHYGPSNISHDLSVVDYDQCTLQFGLCPK